MMFIAIMPVAKHRSVCQSEEIHNFFSTTRVNAKVGCFQKVMFKLNEKSDVFGSSVVLLRNLNLLNGHNVIKTWYVYFQLVFFHKSECYQWSNNWWQQLKKSILLIFQS